MSDFIKHDKSARAIIFLSIISIFVVILFEVYMEHIEKLNIHNTGQSINAFIERSGQFLPHKTRSGGVGGYYLRVKYKAKGRDYTKLIYVNNKTYMKFKDKAEIDIKYLPSDPEKIVVETKE